MPREITVTYTVYKFDELDEKARQKALEKLYDVNVFHDWWDFVYMDADTIGLKITGFDIGYSLEISGDLTLSPEDCAKAILEHHGKPADQEGETGTRQVALEFLEKFNELQANLTKFEEKYEQLDENSNETLSDQLYDAIKDTKEEIEELEEEFKKDLLREYLSILRSEYDYLTSEEAIVEAIESNDYEFTEDGDIH